MPELEALLMLGDSGEVFAFTAAYTKDTKLQGLTEYIQELKSALVEVSLDAWPQWRGLRFHGS